MLIHQHECHSYYCDVHYHVCADLIQQMDSGHHVLLALLDLSAAFDTVDHCILIERLSRSFAVCDGVLDWLRDYLAGRCFTVRFGGK